MIDKVIADTVKRYIRYEENPLKGENVDVIIYWGFLRVLNKHAVELKRNHRDCTLLVNICSTTDFYKFQNLYLPRIIEEIHLALLEQKL